jgi:hypothetical protein
MQAMIEQFVGNEVQVYPNDSWAKFARVIDINPVGVTFLVTKSEASAWKVGTIKFVAFSANLSFTLVQ